MAPRKKIDPIKAKEAKQKKIAIGGIVVLLLLLAVQGPKTMKMLQGPQPVTPAAAAAAATPATPPVTASGQPVPTAAAPVAGEATAAATPDLASVADSDAPPVAADGQLVTFERFQSKDPFAPQATLAPAPAASDGAAASDGGGGAAPAGGGGTVTPAEPAGDGSTPVDGGFTPAPAEGSPAAPDAPSLATATSIAVNGTAQDVVLDTPFPTDQPTFVLVSVAKDGKSVQLGIAGGSYANGEQTIKLVAGKPLTLQNTADGTRFVIELRSVAGFPAPKQ